jgi:hypothetical protein
MSAKLVTIFCGYRGCRVVSAAEPYGRNLGFNDPIEKQIKRQKWKWIGGTSRGEGDAIKRQALEWNPQGSRRRVGPRGTRRRNVLNEAGECGKTWQDIKALARNGVRWKAFTEVLCS